MSVALAVFATLMTLAIIGLVFFYGMLVGYGRGLRDATKRVGF